MSGKRKNLPAHLAGVQAQGKNLLQASKDLVATQEKFKKAIHEVAQRALHDPSEDRMMFALVTIEEMTR